jgi:hypothetical protein
MPQTVAVALSGAFAVVAGLAGLGWLRWQYLRARPGCFPCFVVEGEGPARRERAGLAAFTPMALEWFARNSLNPAAARRWPRRSLSIKARELAPGSKAGWQVVQLRSGGDTVLLVISRGASTGLLSWIEAGPTRPD